MKILFSKPGKYVHLADRNRLIFGIGKQYFDINGNDVPPEESFVEHYDYDDSDNPWKESWIENEGLKEPLVSESTIEPEETVDDLFGNYGFKNKDGVFVIEPQYAFAYNFTCGLAAVNLNRTWYKTADGHRCYENHFGYIDGLGKTIIPFVYDEAYPFNKYGVAVVSNYESFFIDTSGKIIPGTEDLSPNEGYDYSDRFIDFSPRNQDTYCPIGLYDTKERKVILEPKYYSFIEYNENLIKVSYEKISVSGPIYYDFFVNSKGEQLFPWLLDKGFSSTEPPNKHNLAVVSLLKEVDITDENPDSYVLYNGRKFDRIRMVGLYSSKGKFVIPMEYEKIFEIADNIFVCQKGGLSQFIRVDETDL